MLSVKIFTLFPEVFAPYLNSSVLGKALANGIWKYEVINIRDYAKDKHKKVDDAPFGGGCGMVIRPDVIADAIDANCNSKTKIYFMSPRGKVFNHEKIDNILQHEEIAIICGRYEGLDQRVIDYYNMEEISIGDFVLTGGELPAMAIIDACVRFLDGTLAEGSLEQESFVNNLLEYPLYTQPREWREVEVPSVLLLGHHKNIENWKLEEAKKITRERRKDMWEKFLLSEKS